MRRTLFLVAALGVALLVLTACGSSQESNGTSKGTSSTPSAPTETAIPPTATPVPDDISAEQLRRLVVAAANAVENATWDSQSGGNSSTYTATKLYSMTTFPVGSVGSLAPPLQPDDRLDYLTTADGKEYVRVNNGPWRHDADRAESPPPQPMPLPQWLLQMRPVGDQQSYLNGTLTSTSTVTDLAAAPAPSAGQNRCWTLTVTLSAKKVDSSGSPEEDLSGRFTFSVCEPSFLVTSETVRPANPDVADTVLNYRYNSEGVPEAPTQAVEVHCGAFNRGGTEWFNCMFE